MPLAGFRSWGTAAMNRATAASAWSNPAKTPTRKAACALVISGRSLTEAVDQLMDSGPVGALKD